MNLRFPLMWLALVAMWLALIGTITLGQTILGMVVAVGAMRGLRVLQEPSTRARAPVAAVRLAGVVVVDVVRSNVAVAAIVLHPRTRAHVAGFLEIPLELRNPAGLAALACIITSTPGTCWAGYDSRSGVLTMHILDLDDREAWIRTIKDRYERPLLEIFQ
jgi:multicomponent K+:H+ antiporter subunit E